MIQALRGMKDLLGDDAKKYKFCVEKCAELAKNFGFEYIQTPTLEETKLFKRSVGESSDIVGKEMYQFIDKGENDVCLRPEGTAGVVRAFVEHKLDRSLATFKFFYYGNMYRYERPQKGRLRQFHQFGVESFGEDNVKEDASVILLASEILKAFDIKTTLHLNTLGDEDCMPQYKKKLVSFLDEQSELCEDCQRRKTTNPIRVFDCKNEKCQEILKDAPKLIDNLSESSKNDFEELQKLLTQNGIEFIVDTKLVRGLDYYNKTAFEFVSDDLGAQSTVIGGGRYDKLVEFLDGKPTCGVGFAMGIERLMELVKVPESEREGYYFGSLDDEGLDEIFVLANKKRASEKVNVDYKSRSLKAHLKQADKKNALWCVCIGEQERKSESVWIKNLSSKEEQTLKIKEFLEN